jgi:hypothetical protein
MNDSPTQKTILFTAWAVILTLALFKIVLQEVFRYPVSEIFQFGFSALIVLTGFAAGFWESPCWRRAVFSGPGSSTFCRMCSFSRSSPLASFPRVDNPHAHAFSHAPI